MAKAAPKKEAEVNRYVPSISDFSRVYQIYQTANADRDTHMPVWQRISQFVGINVDPTYAYANNDGNQATQLDEYMDDPTAAISVNQAGDYLIGIMWGTGEKTFTLKPSRYVKEILGDNIKTVEKYYTFATEEALYQMNHAEAGLNNSMMAYAYDQFAFGTSAIGAFPNMDFKTSVSESAILFRNYGVDNMAIDEGKSGSVDLVFVMHQWEVSRIVQEFAYLNDELNDKLFAKLPQAVRYAWGNGNYNMTFKVVCAVLPRSDYNPRLKGKKGSKFKGCWFIEGNNQNDFFCEEDFKTKPIAVARQVRVRGDKWGRSSGTLLLSTISSANFMLGETIEVIEKMNQPPLGVTSNAIFGDSAIDTSSDGVTVLNNALSTQGDKSIFPLFDVGNPAELIKFLIPYLEGKITTAMKVDLLLDFNSAQQMTATESLQRYAIRGKSLAGTLTQQKVELLIPLVSRSIQILMDLGALGISAKTNPDAAAQLKKFRKNDRIIPQAIQDCIARGLPWYEIKFNNELEKLVRTEAIQNLTQIIQAVAAIQPLYPQIVAAVNWYKLLAEINENLPTAYQIVLTEQEFKAAVVALAQQQQQAAQGANQAQQAKDQSQTELNQARVREINGKVPQVQL